MNEKDDQQPSTTDEVLRKAWTEPQLEIYPIDTSTRGGGPQPMSDGGMQYS